jgi:hypothetical protein
MTRSGSAAIRTIAALRLRPRHCVILVFFALLLTLLASWLPLWFPGQGRPERKARDSSGSPSWELWIEHAPGRDTIAYWRMQVSGLNVAIPQADFERDKIDLNQLLSSLRPARLADIDLFAVFTTTGWPMRALACSVEDVSQSSKRRGNEHWRVSAGLFLYDRGNLPPRVLPVGPLWPGFLVNAAMYAAILFTLFSSTRAAKRAFRTRRGRCPGCGYSRIGLSAAAPCPECGALGQQSQTPGAT